MTMSAMLDSRLSSAVSSMTVLPLPLPLPASSEDLPGVPASTKVSAPSSSVSAIDPSVEDSTLAAELYNLSFQDRSRIEEEIHGVQTVAVEETPEMVSEALRAFQLEVDKLPTSQKQAYEDAIVMDSKFVQDTNLHLKYLRATLFDPYRAAVNFGIYLDLLLSYFGPTALQRPIRYDDLGKAEKDNLRDGLWQVLPSRDRAGRLVCINLSTMDDVSLECRLRTGLYFFSAISEDVESQKLGIVMMLNHKLSAETVGKSIEELTRPEIRPEYTKFSTSVPVRYSAVHFCLDVPDDSSSMTAMHLALFSTMRALLISLLRHTARVRTRVHQGLSMETLYRLMSFGLKVEEIPVTSSGTIKTKNHLQWIKTRRAIEERRRLLAIPQQQQFQHQATEDGAMEIDTNVLLTTATASAHNDVGGDIIVHPGIHDVLIAKGGKSNHWGNIDFQGLMATSLPEYTSLPKRSARRKEIRAELIQAVYAGKGRFLEMDDERVSGSSSRNNASDCAIGSGHNNAGTTTGPGGNSNGSPGKKKVVAGDWWREITDEEELDGRIKSVIYDYSRRLEAKRNIRRYKSDTTQFSGLEGTNNINIKRRRLFIERGDGNGATGGRGDDEYGGSDPCLSACGFT